MLYQGKALFAEICFAMNFHAPSGSLQFILLFFLLCCCRMRLLWIQETSFLNIYTHIHAYIWHTHRFIKHSFLFHSFCSPYCLGLFSTACCSDLYWLSVPLQTWQNCSTPICFEKHCERSSNIQLIVFCHWWLKGKPFLLQMITYRANLVEVNLKHY